MNPIKTLRRLDSNSIWALIKHCVTSPWFILPTLSATKRCMLVSTQLYGRSHYKNGPANAFRHAFWNYLIAKRCHKWQKNNEAVLSWTKKITDWHEGAFPNRELAKKMDLHNNEVGRFLFQNQPSQTENQITDTLKQMVLASVKVDAISDLQSLQNRLIHIIDEA